VAADAVSEEYARQVQARIEAEKAELERKKVERKERKKKRDDAEKKAREAEQVRLDAEKKRLDEIRDQARQKATAGVKARLNGRYYAVRYIRAARPAGRELTGTGGMCSRTQLESGSRRRMSAGSGTTTSTTLKELSMC